MQYIWICCVERGHKAAHGDVFHPSDCEWVGEKNRALVYVLNCDVDGSRRARSVADIRNQRILVLNSDE